MAEWLEKGWRSSDHWPGDSRESDAQRSGVEKKKRGHRDMRIGWGVHS